MLKYIQEVMQALLKESSKSKLRIRKSKGNRFDITRGKTSINPEILAPTVVNEKLDKENTRDIVNLKNTYEMLMKKFVNPKLDLMISGMRSLDQLNLLHLKRKGDMVNFSTVNTNSQQLTNLPSSESKEPHSTVKAKVGWSGQPTNENASTPKVEASLYPSDIHSAFFVLPEIEELSSSTFTKLKQETKDHKTLHKTIENHLPHLRVQNKPVQLVKQIPKSHISKFYDFNKNNNAIGTKEQKGVADHIQPTPSEDITVKDNFNHTSFREDMGITDETKLLETSNNTSPHQMLKDETSCVFSGHAEDTDTDNRNILNCRNSVECAHATELISNTKTSNQSETDNMSLDKKLEMHNLDKQKEKLNLSQGDLIFPENTSVKTNLYQSGKMQNASSHRHSSGDTDFVTQVEQFEKVSSNDNSLSKDKQRSNVTEKVIEAKSETPVINNHNDAYKFSRHCNKKVFRDKYLPTMPKPKESKQRKGSITSLVSNNNLKDTQKLKSSAKNEHEIVNNQYNYLKIAKNKTRGGFENYSKNKGFFSNPTTYDIAEKSVAKTNFMNKNVSEKNKNTAKDLTNINNNKDFEPKKSDRLIKNNLFKSKKEVTKQNSHRLHFKKCKKEHGRKTKFSSKTSLIATLPKSNINQSPESIKTKIISEGKAMNFIRYSKTQIASKEKVTGKVKSERNSNKLYRSHSLTGPTKKNVTKKVLFYKPKAIGKHSQKELVSKSANVITPRSKIETHNINTSKSNVLKNQSKSVINKTILSSKEHLKLHTENRLTKIGIKSISHEKAVNLKEDKIYTSISAPDLIEISSNAARKLHSKKLNPKPMALKMYGKDKCHDIDSYTSDVRSLKSIPVVRKVNNRTKHSKPLSNFKRSSIEKINNVKKDPSALIIPSKIHTRNLFTAEYKANIMVNYLYKRFASTSVERNITSNRLMAKNVTKKVLRVATVPNISDQSNNKTQNTTFSEHIKKLDTVLKHNHNKAKYILPANLMIGTNNSASAAMLTNVNMYKQHALKKNSDSKISSKKPFMEHMLNKPQNNDYKVEVLYSRQNNKTEPISQRGVYLTAATQNNFNTDGNNITSELTKSKYQPRKQLIYKDSNPKPILKQMNHCNDPSAKFCPGTHENNLLQSKHPSTNNLLSTINRERSVHKHDDEELSRMISENKIQRIFNTNSERCQQSSKLVVDNSHIRVKESNLVNPNITGNSFDNVVKTSITPIKVTASKLNLQHKKNVQNVLKGPKKWKSRFERLKQNKIALENSPEKRSITDNLRKITIIKRHGTNNKMHLTSYALSKSCKINNPSSDIGLLKTNSIKVLPNMSNESSTEFIKERQRKNQLGVSNKQVSNKCSNNVIFHGEKQTKLTEINNQNKKEQTKININTNQIIKQKETRRISSALDITKLNNETWNIPKISNIISSEATKIPKKQNSSQNTDNKVTISLSTHDILPEVKPFTKMVPLNITGVDHSFNKTLVSSSNKLNKNKKTRESNRSLKTLTKTVIPEESKGVFNHTDKSNLKIKNETSITEKDTNKIINSKQNTQSKCQTECKDKVADQNTSNIKCSAENNVDTFNKIEKDDINKHHTKLFDSSQNLTEIRKPLNTRLLKDSKQDYVNDIKKNYKLPGTSIKRSMPYKLENVTELDRRKSVINKLPTMSKEATIKSKQPCLMDSGNKKDFSSKLTNFSKKATESSKLSDINKLDTKNYLSTKLTNLSNNALHLSKSFSRNKMIFDSKLSKTVDLMTTESCKSLDTNEPGNKKDISLLKLTDLSKKITESSRISDSNESRYKKDLSYKFDISKKITESSKTSDSNDSGNKNGLSSKFDMNERKTNPPKTSWLNELGNQMPSNSKQNNFSKMAIESSDSNKQEYKKGLSSKSNEKNHPHIVEPTISLLNDPGNKMCLNSKHTTFNKSATESTETSDSNKQEYKKRLSSKSDFNEKNHPHIVEPTISLLNDPGNKMFLNSKRTKFNKSATESTETSDSNKQEYKKGLSYKSNFHPHIVEPTISLLNDPGNKMCLNSKRTKFNKSGTESTETSDSNKQENKKGLSSKSDVNEKNQLQTTKSPISYLNEPRNEISSKQTKFNQSSKSAGAVELSHKNLFSSIPIECSEHLPESHKSSITNYSFPKLTDTSNNSTDSIVTLHSQSKPKTYERIIDYGSKRNTLHEGLLRSLKLTVHPVQNIPNLNHLSKSQTNSCEKSMLDKKEKEKLLEKFKTNKDITYSESRNNIKVHQKAIAELRKFEKKTKEGVKTIVNHMLNKASKSDQIYQSPPQTPVLENQITLDNKVHPIEKEKYDLVFLAPDEDSLSHSQTHNTAVTSDERIQSSLRHVEQHNVEEMGENKAMKRLKPTATQMNSCEPKRKITYIKKSSKEDRIKENSQELLLL